ncbi:glutamate 5-kinase [Candidatus Woesearchaeota archaeon]|nr:glutamate 5-kinase [Candidatus Woesearchaeota archaeon]
MRDIKAKRIVVKIGTNVITDVNGTLDLDIMKKLVTQIAEIKNRRKEVIIITSGAIGFGMKELQLKTKPKDVVMQQVCASIGQHILMSKYQSLFNKHSIKVAQILLTYYDFSNKKTFNYLHNSLNRLLDFWVVPIINENDPISINEIGPSFGDNDILSALIASKMRADLLVVLTNVDGLYDMNPNHKNATLINEVANIDKRIESIGGKPNGLGLGGMKTKIKAAKIATKSGVTVVIANGRANNTLTKVLNNENIGTIFYPKS